VLSKFKYAVANAVATLIARRIEAYCEKHTLMRMLNERHTGASVDWLGEILEVRGRHALVAAHH
jgi:hypothetical protein